VKRNIDRINFMGLTVLLVYITFISWRLFFYAYSDNFRGQMTNVSYNLIPFKTVLNYIQNSGHLNFEVLFYNLAGNVAAFMPLGFLLPLAFKRFKAAKTFMVAFALILFAEVMQLVSRRGVFDVDDLLLNMLGSIIGYGIYRLLFIIFKGGR
jgi:glycopeptide antibiotics resistance protein